MFGNHIDTKEYSIAVFPVVFVIITKPFYSYRNHRAIREDRHVVFPGVLVVLCRHKIFRYYRKHRDTREYKNDVLLVVMVCVVSELQSIEPHTITIKHPMTTLQKPQTSHHPCGF